MSSRDAFLAQYAHVAEHSPWVAEEAWERLRDRSGPDGDHARLVAALAAAIRDAPVDRQLALLRAHPDLAGKVALAGDLTADSAAEQASAGLDRLDAEELARFHRLNDAYRERFGFPFVICVRNHTKASILAAYEERLGNAAADELRTALDEVVAIVSLRVG